MLHNVSLGDINQAKFEDQYSYQEILAVKDGAANTAIHCPGAPGGHPRNCALWNKEPVRGSPRLLVPPCRNHACVETHKELHNTYTESLLFPHFLINTSPRLVLAKSEHLSMPPSTMRHHTVMQSHHTVMQFHHAGPGKGQEKRRPYDGPHGSSVPRMVGTSCGDAGPQAE